MLICICGIDGSGKSRVIEYLANEFSQINVPIKCIDPMKNGLLVRALRQLNSSFRETIDPTLLSSCYANDMLHCIEHLPQKKDQIILTHRYDICCRLYAELSGADVSYITTICSKLPKPSLYIYMDVYPEIAVMRIKKRSGDKVTPKESLQNLYLAREKYLELISQNTQNIIKIENNGTFDEVVPQLQKIVREVKT